MNARQFGHMRRLSTCRGSLCHRLNRRRGFRREHCPVRFPPDHHTRSQSKNEKYFQYVQARVKPVKHPEFPVLRIRRGKLVDNAAQTRDGGREQEVFRGNDPEQKKTQGQRGFPRLASKQEQQEEASADGELRALPIEKNPVVLFRGMPAEDDTLPRPAYCTQLGRSAAIAGRLKESVDGLKILRDGNIGNDARAEPGAQQKSAKPTILDHVAIVADALLRSYDGYRLAGGFCPFMRRYSTICP
jgi:hypothetical protein